MTSKRPVQHAVADSIVGCSLPWIAPITSIIAPAISLPPSATVYLIQFDKLEESEAHPLAPMELHTLEELSDMPELRAEARQLVQDPRR